jgi:adenylate cyclase
MSGTRKIAAILVADVVGCSRLAGAEDHTLARPRGLRGDLIDPAIDNHQGCIVKRTADGGFVEFCSESPVILHLRRSSDVANRRDVRARC